MVFCTLSSTLTAKKHSPAVKTVMHFIGQADYNCFNSRSLTFTNIKGALWNSYVGSRSLVYALNMSARQLREAGKV